MYTAYNTNASQYFVHAYLGSTRCAHYYIYIYICLFCLCRGWIHLSKKSLPNKCGLGVLKLCQASEVSLKFANFLMLLSLKRLVCPHVAMQMGFL